MQKVSVPPEVLRQVKLIELRTRRLVNSLFAGEYRSIFKGHGMEFAEVREYMPGDEVRSIDWNVTARMGHPFVKQFVEERDLTVFLAVDVSGSLGFGSRAILKRELAAEIAGLIAFSALRNQDRVGAALLSDRVELFLRPQRRRNHVLRLVREILGRPAHGATDLESSLAAALANLKRRSVLFLISDFVDAPCEGALKAAAARHDVIVIELVEPNDTALPQVGPVVLRDAETGALALVSGKKLALRHAEARRRERAQLRSLTRRLGLDHLELRTDRPYLSSLVAFFAARRKRLAR